jgi:hypothetical protein
MELGVIRKKKQLLCALLTTVLELHDVLTMVRPNTKANASRGHEPRRTKKFFRARPRLRSLFFYLPSRSTWRTRQSGQTSPQYAGTCTTCLPVLQVVVLVRRSATSSTATCNTASSTHIDNNIITMIKTKQQQQRQRQQQYYY